MGPLLKMTTGWDLDHLSALIHSKDEESRKEEEMLCRIDKELSGGFLGPTQKKNKSAVSCDDKQASMGPFKLLSSRRSTKRTGPAWKLSTSNSNIAGGPLGIVRCGTVMAKH